MMRCVSITFSGVNKCFDPSICERKVTPSSFIFLTSPSFAKEGWSFNLGYHNPPGATLGLNFLRFWTNFAKRSNPNDPALPDWVALNARNQVIESLVTPRVQSISGNNITVNPAPHGTATGVNLYYGRLLARTTTPAV